MDLPAVGTIEHGIHATTESLSLGSKATRLAADMLQGLLTLIQAIGSRISQCITSRYGPIVIGSVVTGATIYSFYTHHVNQTPTTRKVLGIITLVSAFGTGFTVARALYLPV